MEKEDKNYEIKFWKDWLEADSIKRIDLVEKLPIINEFLDMNLIKGKKHSIILKRSFVLVLNNFLKI